MRVTTLYVVALIFIKLDRKIMIYLDEEKEVSLSKVSYK